MELAAATPMFALLTGFVQCELDWGGQRRATKADQGLRCPAKAAATGLRASAAPVLPLPCIMPRPLLAALLLLLLLLGMLGPAAGMECITTCCCRASRGSGPPRAIALRAVVHMARLPDAGSGPWACQGRGHPKAI